MDMGKRIEYYLIARENETNQVKRIPIQGKYGSSLEEIDLMTSQYKNATQLARFLRDGDLMPPVTDFYIAYRDQEKKLRTMEVLYEDSLSIQDLATNSLNHEMEKSNRFMDVILLDFTMKVSQNNIYYEKVLRDKTDLYPKFVEYIRQNRMVKWSELKDKEGGWILKSYPLMRNIVSSLQKLEEKYPIPIDGRKEVENEVFQMTDPEYDENQMHLLDYVQNQKEEDPLSVVMYNLDDLRMEDFIKVDRDIFFQPREEITDEGVIRKLQTLLPEKMIKSFYCLLLEKRLYEQGLEDEWGKQKNGALLEATREEIKIVLEADPKALQSTYEWTKLYQKHQLGMGMNDGERIQK